MKKQLISFTDPQAAFLEEEAARLGVSVAELVRRCVDWYRDTYPNLAVPHVLSDSEVSVQS